MALIGNYSVLNKTAGRWLAGGSSAGTNQAQARSNWNKASDWSKFGLQDGSGGTTSIVTTASKPQGYYPPGAWAMPTVEGGLSSSRLVLGNGSITNGNLAGGKNGEAVLTGSGDITEAALGLIVSAVAALTGSASVSASIVGKLEAAADLAGAGDLDGAILALANLAAALAGDGGIDVDLTALGWASSDIIVTGDVLNSANVGAAVWSTLLEGELSAEEIMRLLAAVMAAKSSGGGTATVTFRDLGDTKDRIVATVDSNGNRTAITRDAS